jgi:CRISPR/Cas system CSM-associated protein Csm3 (group 7 of RAMP superfamily)
MITLLTLRLTALEPFAVTAPQISEATDLPVCKDPVRNILVMPGATIAGSLRSHIAKLLGVDTAADWFGPIAGTKGADSVDRSSVVRVVGVLLHDESDQPLPGTAVFAQKKTTIDRKRRAAVASSLRDSLVVPAGAHMSCFVRIEDPNGLPDSASQNRLASGNSLSQLFAALSSWSPVIGRGKSSGHGRMRLHTIKHGSLDFSNPNDRWRWVASGGTALFDEVCTNEITTQSIPIEQVLVTTVRIMDPLRLGGGDSERNVRKLPVRKSLISGQEDLAPYDGSSFKGVVRSRCEYIVKSIRAAKGDPSHENSAIDLLFGSVDQRGALRFVDTPVSNERLGFRSHVAIDRVSGGARDSALFVDEVFEDGFLDLSIEWLATSPVPSWVRELLSWVLQDLDDALFGIAASSNRGYGTMQRVNPTPASLSSGTIEILRFGVPGLSVNSEMSPV